MQQHMPQKSDPAVYVYMYVHMYICRAGTCMPKLCLDTDTSCNMDFRQHIHVGSKTSSNYSQVKFSRMLADREKHEN